MVDGEKSGVGSRDERKHTGRSGVNLASIRTYKF